jgi:hypothetical protein
MAKKNSSVKRESMFRDFLHKDKQYRERNVMKNYRVVTAAYQKKYELNLPMLGFMTWAYDLEFFTLDYASKDMKWNKRVIYNRCVQPLKTKGFIFKYFEKLTPSRTHEDAMFRDEHKMNYRVRYALTAQAMRIIESYYRDIAAQRP